MPQHQVINDPWPHAILDHYYDLHLFDSMVSEIQQRVTSLDAKGQLPNRLLFPITDPNFSREFPHTTTCIRSKRYEELLSLFPERRQYQGLGLTGEISIMSRGESWPIHDENERKVLSCVTYIAPTVSRGTTLYTTNKQLVGDVEWQPNRTLVFAGITGKTWHSYASIESSYRVTLNVFLTKTVDGKIVDLVPKRQR